MLTKDNKSKRLRQDPKPLVGPIKHQTPIAKTSTGHVYVIGARLEGTSDLDTRRVEVGQFIWRPRQHDDGLGPRDDPRGRLVRKAIEGLAARGISLAGLPLKQQRKYVKSQLWEDMGRVGKLPSRQVINEQLRRWASSK
jgi:hypothetical protein